MKRIASAVVLAALMLAAVASPAQAAGNDVVTVKGHAYNEKGNPLSGIKVSGGCQCGFEGPAPAYSGTTVMTGRDGYFSFKLLRKYASYVSYNDSKNRYLFAAGKLKKKAGAYVSNKTLYLASEVAGTVRDDSGKPAKFVEVKFYDAITGKRVREQGEGMTDKNGHFHALVPGGSYKIRMSGVNHTYAPEWYGDSATRAASPVVSVKRGGKTAGVNGTLTKQLRIVGQVKLDADKRIFGNGDRIKMRATDAAGTVLTDDFAEGYFFVEKLQPGTYTLEFYPDGSNFFIPKTVTYTLVADTSLEQEKVVLTQIAASATDKRSAVFAWGSPPSDAKKGNLYKADFVVLGYGNVTGGTVTLYADGIVLDTAMVPASGKITLASRFAGVSAGTYPLVLKFSGTETTLPTELTTSINVKVTN